MKKAAYCTIAVLAVSALYLLVAGRHGWSTTDDGFVLGLAWRVHNGELPYRDFLYVSPPLTPLLHSLWYRIATPGYAVVLGRFAYIVQLLTAALLTARFAAAASDDPKLKIAWPAYGLGGFLLSVTVLTPMPWHTADGLFFGALALLALQKPTRAGAYLSGALFALAALTKQSYYPLLPAALAYLLYRRERARVWAYLEGSLTVLGIFAAWLSSNGLTGEFLAQTAGAATARDLLDAGVLAYITKPAKLLGITLVLALAGRLGAKHLKKPWTTGYDALLLIGVALVLAIKTAAKTGAWASPTAHGLPQALMLLALASLLFRRKGRGELALALALAWCAGLSWGFATPVLLAAPLLLGSAELVRQTGGEPQNTIKFAGIALLALVALWRPYQDAPRNRLGTPLGDPPHITTTPENLAKLEEARSIARAHPGGDLAYLPGIPLAYPLFGLKNPLPLDWPLNAQTGGRNDRVRSALEEKVRWVAVDRAQAQAKTPSRCTVEALAEVTGKWKLVGKNTYYDLYEPPETNQAKR